MAAAKKLKSDAEKDYEYEKGFCQNKFEKEK